MAILEVVKMPDPVLRRKAHKVNQIDADIRRLIADMIDTLHDEPGVGLAATQVGIPNRVIIVEYNEDEDVNENARPKLYVVVNPEIIRQSEETEMGIEACLSVPNLVGEVDRYSEIVVRGLNRQGRPTKIKAQGWLARIFQHEIDHLDGVLFTDRAIRVWQPQEADAEYDAA
jgi:peptide deformylase